jgi:hypothetical protein
MSPAEDRSPAGAVPSRFWVLFGSIWLVIGLPFVLLAFYFLLQERQLETTGRVVEAMVLTKGIDGSSDMNRSVTYRFTSADGQPIEGKSDVGESLWNSLTERGPVSIAYLPNRPAVNHVVGTSKLTLLIIFSFVGGLLSIAGGTIVTVARSSARTKRRLLTAGVRVPATVAEVKDMNLRVNGRTQWRLKYDYHDFRSRPHRRSLYLDADEASLWKPGDAGEVLFDPDRPDRAIWLGRADP